MDTRERYRRPRTIVLRRSLAVLAALLLSPTVLPAQSVACDDTALGATAVYQGAQGSDAFSAMHYLGNGRIIAGKRSSGATNRFALSEDYGATWSIVGCPNSTGAHTYFFGQNGALVLSGTGDTGNACLMKSVDAGQTWTVALTSAQIRGLIGSNNALAVFSPVYLGAARWLANVKSFDTPNKVILSTDNGATWYVPSAQPGQGPAAWARRMILTGDNILLWPSCLTDRMYRSTDQGAGWSSVTVPGASLFQPLCDAGNGIYLCGDVRTTPNTPIRLYRSIDMGLSWTVVAEVNLQRPTTTYWRDVIKVDDSLLASACCVEGSSNERYMQLFLSVDDGATWVSLGNPYYGPYGGMQAIYQMCATELNVVFAGCQPDSTILRWPMPVGVDSGTPGDLDCDADIDFDDFSLLSGALAGPLVWEPPPGCDRSQFTRADLDDDIDVDLADFATFQRNPRGTVSADRCSVAQPPAPGGLEEQHTGGGELQSRGQAPGALACASRSNLRSSALRWLALRVRIRPAVAPSPSSNPAPSEPLVAVSGRHYLGRSRRSAVPRTARRRR